MKRPSIRIPDVIARLARRAAVTPDGFPPVLSGFPKGGVPGLDFGPDRSSTGSPGSDDRNPSSSTTPTSGTPSPSTVSAGSNKSSSSTTTAVATVTASSVASPARLPPAAVGGIAVGSSLSLLALVVVVWLVMRFRQRRRDRHVQLDDGASDGTVSSRRHVGDFVPFARKTVETDVESSPPSPSLCSTGASADTPDTLPVPSQLADNDAPPAYEELTGGGRHAVTIGLQAAPGINSVSDGFRQYGPALEGDSKGLQ